MKKGVNVCNTELLQNYSLIVDSVDKRNDSTYTYST